MIIGVDAGALSVRDERLKVGIYRLASNLLQQLGKLDHKNTYRLYSFTPLDRGLLETFGPNMTNIVLAPPAGFTTIRLPIELKINPVDVYLGLAQVLPVSLSHNIGFIYDLGFLYHPQAYDNPDKLMKNTQKLCQRADHIFTISNFSKNDILHKFSFPQNKISVAYPGIDSVFLKKGTLNKAKYPYFLFVGSLNKVKNIPFLLKSFRIFLEMINKPYDLVLVGGDYWPDSLIEQTIYKLQLGQRVKRMGYLDDQRLASLYRGAVALVSSSYHEGFCLPVAEAFALDLPVISLANGAMAEIVGKAGIIVRKNDEKDFSAAMFQLVNDIKLQNQLKRLARLRAKLFSWKRFAVKVLARINIYENIAYRSSS